MKVLTIALSVSNAWRNSKTRYFKTEKSLKSRAENMYRPSSCYGVSDTNLLTGKMRTS